MRLLRRFVEGNERISYWLSRQAERAFGRRSGMQEFHHRVLARLLKPDLRILDVGGGKRPAMDPNTKAKLRLCVTGLDLSADELAQAPAGAYDAIIVGDVATVSLQSSYDLILSHTVLEHVRDTAAALANMSSALRPGGAMVHYIPCANAPFAILNRLLGNRLSRGILWRVYPVSRSVAGYPAFYANCTPRRMRQLCERSGLNVTEVIPYFCSDYARFFAPLHVVDLARQLLLMWLRAHNLAEAFTIIATNPKRPIAAVPPRETAVAKAA